MPLRALKRPPRSGDDGGPRPTRRLSECASHRDNPRQDQLLRRPPRERLGQADQLLRVPLGTKYDKDGPLRGGSRRKGDPCVLLQDCPFELSKRAAGLDPELIDERAPGRVVRLESFGLSARAVEREHQLRSNALAQRVLGDEGLQFADETGVSA